MGLFFFDSGNKCTPTHDQNDVMKERSEEIRFPRRQFLANLLFAGGMVTLSSLQAAQAQQSPTDGWTLPDLNTPSPQPTPRPKPKTPKPTPPLPGKPRPPIPPPTAGVPLPPSNPRGRVVLPGEVQPPPPKQDCPPPKRQ